jgi:hypothetical protein
MQAPVRNNPAATPSARLGAVPSTRETSEELPLERSTLEAEILGLRQRLAAMRAKSADLRQEMDDLRRERDHWRTLAEPQAAPKGPEADRRSWFCGRASSEA